ncbi:MAG: tricorn protease [Saprospiraceae bacterium]|jgi:tricorn protease
MKYSLVLLVSLFFCYQGQSQVSAKLMRYADISETQIVFVYGGDLWLVDRSGGTALQLTHSLGEESYPRFSPDGTEIAYTASYNGNLDVFTIPVIGGIPKVITSQSWADRTIDWHPDGQSILFASRREIGPRSSRQFFSVSKEGGHAEKLPIPYGELASYSPDGSKLAYITKITENYPFKRYRGGLTSDIYIYDTASKEIKNITDNIAIDGKPSWAGERLYFLSDRDEHMRLNIWSYDPMTKALEQLTKFTDFDISNLSAGPDALVFEMGGTMHTMNLSDHTYQPVEIQIISDLSVEMPRAKNVSGSIRNMTAAPGGKRLVLESRGELFDVPVKEGVTLNMTKSSGAWDRNPSWSPDGHNIAFWSDRSGENEIYLQEYDGKKELRKLTNHNIGYGYRLYWSPDNKYLTYIDYKNNINLIDVATGAESIVDNMDWNVSHPGRNGFGIEWSPDSKWLTYEKSGDNSSGAIYVYNLESKEVSRATSDFYDDSNPVFSKDGKYLFYTTNRNLSPHYSDMNDGTWVYPNATQIGVLPLTKEVGHLLGAKNDEVKLEPKEDKKEDEEAIEEKEKDKKKKKKKGDKKDDKEEKDEKDDDEKEKEDEGVKVEIDLEDIESRLFLLPIDAGNIGGLMAFEDGLAYVRLPNTGSEKEEVAIMLYNFEDREESAIMENVNGSELTADGKKIIVRTRGGIGIINPKPGQKIKDRVPTDGMVMNHVPREEWRQLFNDAWRRHRDFFYDPNMHGIDWKAMKDRYGALIEDARTRWDVNFVISNLAAELSAGHTYTFGGDTEQTERQNTGYLGVDWELEGDMYRIKRIVRPAAWDTDVRSPLDVAGVNVKVGDYVHSVNGNELSSDQEAYAAFNNLGGKTASILVSSAGKIDSATKYLVQCLRIGDESRLRHLEWIENNRKKVEELSDGKLGYIYMSNTGGQGQMELVRMYYGQLDKEGFIIDERFNGGGQLADRFLELLQRPVVYNLHWRHGRDHIHPTKANPGPMGMLINGWAGSGGDGLPWAFQELEAGPIVGERTLGILVGPATRHRLIDGGGITVPGARLYDNDGHWFWEGEGVAPDIKVWDDPNLLMQDRDPQIERVVSEVMELLKTEPGVRTPAPALEDRTAKGQRGK